MDISKLAKLREHYQNEGAARAVHLEIPKGGYHLAFVRAPRAVPARNARDPRGVRPRVRLQGLTPDTHVMVLSCSSTEGTGAAAEYVTRADTPRELFRKVGVDPQARPLPLAFQVVVKAHMKGGVPVQLSHVAHHVLAP